MGEALLSRSTIIPDEILNPIDPIPGICILVVEALDDDNKPIQNLKVGCIDGTMVYNYTTNEKGKTRFSTNSGQVNVVLYNVVDNGTKIMDYVTTNYNAVEAPVITVQNKSFKLNYRNYASFGVMGIDNFIFITANRINFNLAAAGGGGTGACVVQGWSYSDGWSGGRGGNLVKNNFVIEHNQIYSVSVGGGGRGGSNGWVWDPESSNGARCGAGGSGGTSTAFGQSCTGGGGSPSYGWWDIRFHAGRAGTSYGSGGSGGGPGGTYMDGPFLKGRDGGTGSPGWLYVNMMK